MTININPYEDYVTNCEQSTLGPAAGGPGLTTWVPRVAVCGFINYLNKYEERKLDNREP